MKTLLIMIMTALIIVGLTGCSGNDQDQGKVQAEKKSPAPVTEKVVRSAEEQNLEECRAATNKLGGALKSALQEAMGEGGPVAAVNVCHDQAAVIARQISSEEGLIVGRTSNKVRNPDNAPDEWEKAGLATFQAHLMAGEKPKDLEIWTTVTEADGSRTFRYLKAIPTAPICLKCHGAELDSGLAETLLDLYPADQATGFAVGDLRGAFTVKKQLPRS